MRKQARVAYLVASEGSSQGPLESAPRGPRGDAKISRRPCGIANCPKERRPPTNSGSPKRRTSPGRCAGCFFVLDLGQAFGARKAIPKPRPSSSSTWCGTAIPILHLVHRSQKFLFVALSASQECKECSLLQVQAHFARQLLPY